MNYLERLQRRRASWQRELDMNGPLAKHALRTIALIDEEIGTVLDAVKNAPGREDDAELA